MEDIWAVRFVVLIQSQAWSRSREHAGERGLTHVQRVAPQVVAVKFDQVEGPHEHVCVVVPVPDTIEGCDPIVTARHGLPVDDTGLRAQLGQRLDYEGKAVGQIVPRSAVEPHPLAALRAMTRKPSCLISCSHSFPDGGAEALVGRHGAMKPGGSGREYSDMGRWDRRHLRGGQQNRGSGGPRNSLSDPSLSTLPCSAFSVHQGSVMGDPHRRSTLTHPTNHFHASDEWLTGKRGGSTLHAAAGS